MIGRETTAEPTAGAAAGDSLVFHAGSHAGSVADAAMAATSAYAATEIEKQAKAILAATETSLKARTDAYTRRAMQAASNSRKAGFAPEIAEPIVNVPPMYPYWNLFLYGPFQPLGGPGGPFLPHKAIRGGEPAFMLALTWRNPSCINWLCPAPSAATLMSAYQFRVRIETINLSSVTNGPDYQSPIQVFGPGFLNAFVFWVSGPLSPSPLPAGPQGAPFLYELNATTDIVGPVPGLPFAGTATWVFDPDVDPFPPMPTVPAGWQYDIPARLLVYTA